MPETKGSKAPALHCNEDPRPNSAVPDLAAAYERTNDNSTHSIENKQQSPFMIVIATTEEPVQ